MPNNKISFNEISTSKTDFFVHLKKNLSVSDSALSVRANELVKDPNIKKYVTRSLSLSRLASFYSQFLCDEEALFIDINKTPSTRYPFYSPSSTKPRFFISSSSSSASSSVASIESDCREGQEDMTSRRYTF